MILQALTLAIVGFTLWTIASLTNTLGRFIVIQNQTLQQAVDTITSQLVKAQREVVSRIADVQAQLDAAGVAEQIDLSSLTAAAQALDDVVPDVVPEVVPDVVPDVEPDVEPDVPPAA